MRKRWQSFFSRTGDGKRLLELGKDVLIVFLIISAVFLANKGGLLTGVEKHPFSELWESVTGAGSRSETDGGEYAAAASPYCLVMTPQDGSHCAVCWGDERLGALYARLSPVLGEALGSSKEPKAVTEEEWFSALHSSGVYFDFVNEQQLSVLASWLGTGISGGAGPNTARRMVLAKDGDSVAVYYLRARDGTAYCCATALSWSAVYNKMTDCLPNGAYFNFERSEPFGSVEPCMVITEEAPELPGLTAVNSMPTASVEVNAMLDALGMNSYLASPYADKDGTVVFVEGDAEVRIGTDGVLRFTGGSGDGMDRLPQGDAVELVRTLTEKTIGRGAGEAGLMLSYIGYNLGTEEYTIRFDYSVNGLPVVFSGGRSAAEVTVSGGAVTSAELVFRGYYGSDVIERPLGSLQAAAVAEAKGGGDLQLCYLDDADSVSVQWLIK